MAIINKHTCGCANNAANTEAVISAIPAEAVMAVENNCREQLRNCCSVPPVCRPPCNQNCNGIPIAVEPADVSTTYERCCDRSGCCGLYPICCRNPFWPSFAKPTCV